MDWNEEVEVIHHSNEGFQLWSCTLLGKYCTEPLRLEQYATELPIMRTGVWGPKVSSDSIANPNLA